MAFGKVHDTAPHSVVSAGRPLTSRRSRRRGPRSTEAVGRRFYGCGSLQPLPVSLVSTAAVQDAAEIPHDHDPDIADIVSPEPPHVPDCGEDIRAVVARGEATPIHDHDPHDNVSPSPGPCEAGPFSCFSILQCNIRGFLCHRAELDGQLKLLATRPGLICLNETFLDESTSDNQLWLGGYKLLSRRDRCDGRSGGGICCFVADVFAEQVAVSERSASSERVWHTIHSDIGPLLLGVWYRPPEPGEVASIRECEDEWRRLSTNAVATILAGDVNVHHVRWLRHSSHNSVEGTTLMRFCLDNGLRQWVKRPTREDNLLDLVISDIEPNKVDILPKISDHNMVMATFNVGVQESASITRNVYMYSQADWKSIRRDISRFDWSPMDSANVDAAERYFHTNTVKIVQRHIPQRVLLERKSQHPWINDRCLQAITAKNATIGTANFSEEAIRCSRVLFDEFVAYTMAMKEKLLKERRGSKRWWQISNEIMTKSSQQSTIPTLSSSSGWKSTPGDKANLFADVFSAKYSLPEIETNEYSTATPSWWTEDFLPVRRRQVQREIAKVDPDSGTGPDGIAARVLNFCADELSFAVTKLIRRIIQDGFWPSAWTEHWLVPLHKRKSTADPGNYRAINLTAQISKIAERYLSKFFVPTLELRAFGSTQFAYRKQHGARDAILLYVLSWIGSLNRGERIGVYCSDVSGAFDKVDADRLMQKLSTMGLSAQMLRVIRSWLRERRGHVVVGGEKSRTMNLKDMVFQGTVWGPPLWNSFFGDCVAAIHACGFQVVIYADDCNAFKAFPIGRSNGLILDELRQCQQSLHKWGRANRVTFDAGKEDTMIISTVDPVGGPVKILGVDFDRKLLMAGAVHTCAVKAAWKSRSLLRVRRFYNVSDLVMLYKSHVLSYIEYRTAGVHFASSSVLAELDDTQRRFLRQLDLSEESAFMNWNLAPLGVRRDIGILGVIHRAVHGEGPPELWKFFRRDLSVRRVSRRERHKFQVIEWPRCRDLDIMRRSALGMIRVYNILPEHVVSIANMKLFQRALTDLVRDRVTAGDHRWKVLLCCRHRLFQFHPLIHS